MKSIQPVIALTLIAILTSCSSTIISVYDQYLKSGVEHKAIGENTTSKRKLLLLVKDADYGQTELIALRTDSGKFLVVGSIKNASSFVINNGTYTFDINGLYDKKSTPEFLEQVGKLNIFYTHVDAGMGSALAAALGGMKSQYIQAAPDKGEVISIDYVVSNDLVFSLEKSTKAQKPTECIIWVGKRKHIVKTSDLEKALTELKLLI